jgi:nucleoside-diphosphate kinase
MIMQPEHSLILLKPDCVERGLMGEVISRIERKGLRIVAMKMIELTRPLAEEHYAVHKGKPFFNDLLDYITSGPIVALAVEGPHAIEVMRRLLGATNGMEANAGTLRGDFSLSVQCNLVHASDSPESAKRELALFFSNDKLQRLPPLRWQS